jgi:hypothetical protein
LAIILGGSAARLLDERTTQNRPDGKASYTGGDLGFLTSAATERAAAMRACL